MMAFRVRNPFRRNGITHFAAGPKRKPMCVIFGNGIHIKLECDEHGSIILPPLPRLQGHHTAAWSIGIAHAAVRVQRLRVWVRMVWDDVRYIHQLKYHCIQIYNIWQRTGGRKHDAHSNEPPIRPYCTNGAYKHTSYGKMLVDNDGGAQPLTKPK